MPSSLHDRMSMVASHFYHLLVFRFFGCEEFDFANAITRSYSSTAITTTTGRSYLVTATGAARARSISSPKLIFASADVMERMWSPFGEPVLAELDNSAMVESSGGGDSGSATALTAGLVSILRRSSCRRLPGKADTAQLSPDRLK